MGSISSSLGSGQDALAKLSTQIKQRDATQVSTFKAYTQDITNDKIESARYIGDFRPNQNRLNAFSVANTSDKEDFFRFNLKSSGNVHLNMLVDSLDAKRKVVESETAKGLGIQVIQYQGSSHRVIADSDPKSGASYDEYKKLSGADGAELDAGKYVVRVYRQPDARQSQEYFYSFQLVGDRYYQDYDTMQSEAPAHPATKSAIEIMTINPAVMLMANSMDATMGAAMVAATRPIRLSTKIQDGVEPVTQLLDAFM